MKEIWKPVKILFRFDSVCNIVCSIKIKDGYSISSHGNLKYKNKVRKNKPDKKGYVLDFLYGVDGKRYRFKRHQIVMQTFKPDGCKNGFSVDHKDRNKMNNFIWNLRWATKSIQTQNRENIKYKFKTVICLNDNIIFESCQEAEKYYGLVKNTVSRVARGERKSIRGYMFSYICSVDVKKTCE